MKIVVDTNIVFSILLNTNSKLGDLLFNSEGIFEFYSCTYMHDEIEKHWEKLKRISKFSEHQLQESRFKVFGKLKFINEELIPEKIWLAAEKFVANVDVDDSDFVALANHIHGSVWTGDKILRTGLHRKNFKRVYNTTEMIALRKQFS